jgi:hypothetical protein
MHGGLTPPVLLWPLPPESIKQRAFALLSRAYTTVSPATLGAYTGMTPAAAQSGTPVPVGLPRSNFLGPLVDLQDHLSNLF